MPLKVPNSFHSFLFIGLSMLVIAAKCMDTRLVEMEVSSMTALEWQDDNGWRHKIEKEDGIWYYAGMEAVDSLAFNVYLNVLVGAEGPSSDDFQTRQDLIFIEQLTLYGTEMADPTTIRAYTQTGNPQMLIYSTAHAEAVFPSDSTGLYKQIFTNLKKFFPDGQ